MLPQPQQGPARRRGGRPRQRCPSWPAPGGGWGHGPDVHVSAQGSVAATGSASLCNLTCTPRGGLPRKPTHLLLGRLGRLPCLRLLLLLLLGKQLSRHRVAAPRCGRGGGAGTQRALGCAAMAAAAVSLQGSPAATAPLRFMMQQEASTRSGGGGGVLGNATMPARAAAAAAPCGRGSAPTHPPRRATLAASAAAAQRAARRPSARLAGALGSG